MDTQNNKERFIELCQLVQRDGIQELLSWLETTDFYTAPASTHFHGAYASGLLQHSLNVYDELERLLKAYPEVECSSESAIICALFHDFCKINCYTAEKRNRKNERGQWESYDAYKWNEQFCYGGHGSKSVYLVQQFIKLEPEEAVAIACHMGAWESDKVGDAYEQFPLAWLVHTADGAATYILERKD